jgi:hypothetical protein
MSGCTRCRWGTNTNPDRPVNTENAKRLESSLQRLVQERQGIDDIWETNKISAPQAVPRSALQALPQQSSPIAIPKRSPPVTPFNTPMNTAINTPINAPLMVDPTYTELTPSKPPTKKNYAGLLYN